jgi:hypothetical protein
MSALPAISHHLFVAAIDEPEKRPLGKSDATDTQAIEVEIIDWSEPAPDSERGSKASLV